MSEETNYSDVGLRYKDYLNKEDLCYTDGTPYSLVILGAGGIGGNFISVQNELARVSTVETGSRARKTVYAENRIYAAEESDPIHNAAFKILAVFDDDEVEISNLNRLPYDVECVGDKKVSTFFNYCAKSFFYDSDSFRNNHVYMERRISTEEEFLSAMSSILGFDSADGSDAMDREAWEYFARINKVVVIDCRDTRDPACIFPEIDIKLTYNGGNIFVIEFNPDAIKDTYQTGGRYTITPSFIAPPLAIVTTLLRIIRFTPYEIFATTARLLKKTVVKYYSLSDMINDNKIPLSECEVDDEDVDDYDDDDDESDDDDEMTEVR